MQIWFHCCKEIRKYENKCVNTTGEKSRKKGKRHLSAKNYHKGNHSNNKYYDPKIYFFLSVFL